MQLSQQLSILSDARSALSAGITLLDVIPATDRFSLSAILGGDFLSCYHPTTLLEWVDTIDGEVHGTWTSIPYDPEKKFDHYLSTKPCPCGTCIGCRLDYSRRWADRMTLELDHTKKGIFVTLTYDDNHITRSVLSDNYTLVYSDLQAFFKRLKDHCSRLFPGVDIRRYAAGEYGDTTLRPHYHAIVFGIDLNDLPDLQQIGFNEFHQPIFACAWLARIWSHGYVSVANVSWQTCAYVSRYTLKKHLGKDADFYTKLGIEPERALMSRRPGIGAYFIQDHLEYFKDTEFCNSVFISDEFGVSPRKSVNLPSYIVNKLDEINPTLYNNIRNMRSQMAQDSLLLELSKTDLGFSEYMQSKEFIKTAQIKALKKTVF